LPPPDVSSLALHDALPISKPTVSMSHTARTETAELPTSVEGQFRCFCGSEPWLGHGGIRVRSSHPTALFLFIAPGGRQFPVTPRSEEHTSELQSRENLVCR